MSSMTSLSAGKPIIATSASLGTSPHAGNPGNFAPSTESVNLLLLPRADRKQLGQGPEFEVFVGNVSLGKIHKKVWMAASTKASTLLNSNSDIRLPKDTNIMVVEELIGFIENIATKDYVRRFRIPIAPGLGITICRTATVLGVDHYVRHLEANYRHFITRTQVTPELMALVENKATAADRFLGYVADRLAYQIRNYDNLHENWTAVTGFPMLYAKVQELAGSWVAAQCAWKAARQAETKE
jgi:hypothetical protein